MSVPDETSPAPRVVVGDVTVPSPVATGSHWRDGYLNYTSHQRSCSRNSRRVGRA